tara:strand:- start:62 stop:322 length:261 start_codon:yes stop_codon:yes gene_type:complete
MLLGPSIALPDAQMPPITKRLQGRAAFKNLKTSRSRPYIRTVTEGASRAPSSGCFVRATAQFHLVVTTIQINGESVERLGLINQFW